MVFLLICLVLGTLLLFFFTGLFHHCVKGLKNNFGEARGAFILVLLLYSQQFFHAFRHSLINVEGPVESFNQTGFASARRSEKQNVNVIGHVVIIEALRVSIGHHFVVQNTLPDVVDLPIHDVLHLNR